MSEWKGKLIRMVAAKVERSEPRYKRVVLDMDGDFYRSLVGTLRSHASYQRQGIVDSGTAATLLDGIERAIERAEDIE